MPAWWSKKSSTSNSSGSKVRQEKKSSSDRSPAAAAAGAASNNSISSSNSKSNRTSNHQNRSFDEICLARGASPRNSKEFVIGSSEGIGLGLPLPRPSPSNLSNFSASAVIDHGVSGYGFGSVSVSSVSSSGSSDDNNNNNNNILTFNEQSQFGLLRGQSETNFNIRPRSPGPSSRAPTTATSPLHPRHSSTSLESSTGKQEDGNSQAHPLPLPLPLPPGSPTSPSSSSNKRINGVSESISNMLSKWRKGRLLGRGSFGHVYVGFNSENGQMCAIKEVKVVSDDRSSKESLKQLNQEINLLSQLSHPNIVQYIGSELNEDTLSVYLEYVSGGSIHKLLQEYGPFKEPVIQNYTRQILSGLAYLHGRNTVHRDVKGANILVDPNGEIKLADFGMAKHITSASSMLSFKGSPYWMAPEVVMNTSGYSLAVDIWSLGCTILEMATAKPPWSQFEGVAAIFKIGNSKDMPDIPEHLSNDAKEFVKLCLRRDPSMRPSAIQLLDHPFIQDQATPRAANINTTRDVFSYNFDGSRTPPAALDLHSNGTTMGSFDADFALRPGFRSARAVRSPRDNTRTITSLPVSPSSSPLRQHMMPFKSTLPSPVHPALSVGGQGGINFNNYSSYTRPNTTYPLDPWQDTPLFRSQTPAGSPRSRPI